MCGVRGSSLPSRRLNLAEGGRKCLSRCSSIRTGLRDRRFELRRFSQNRLNIRLSNITLEDEGIYSCLRYGDPVQRRDVNVTVLAAPSPPVLGFTCSDASSVTLSCSTRGSKPPPRITWLIDNRTEVYGNSHVRLERNGKTCEASSVLRVNSFSPKSRATCIVRHRTLHPAGFMAASFTFQDLNPATVTEPATISTDPVVLTAQPIVTDPVALTAQPIVTDPVALTAQPIVTDPVALTAQPIVTDPVALTAQLIVTDPVALTAQPIVTDPVALTDRATVTELVTLLEQTFAEPVTSPQGPGRNTSLPPNIGTRNPFDGAESVNGTAETMTSSSNLIPTHGHNRTDKGNSTAESEEIRSKSSSVLVLVMVSLMVCVLLAIFHLFLAKLKREHAKWRKETENSDQTLESTRSRSNNEDIANPAKSAQATNQIPSARYTKEEIV